MARTTKPRKTTAPSASDRERFLGLANQGREHVWVREGRTDVCLHGVYRAFASWIDSGPQSGIHLRAETGTKSTRFRGHHNWIHVAKPDWEALPDQLATARTIASRRGGGRPPAPGTRDIYKPLAKALAQATAPPANLHAAGPRAKVLSGERNLAVALCRMCMKRLVHLDGGDPARVAKLAALLDKSLRSERWWPAANALPYGTDSAKRAADDAEPAALQMVRAAIGAQNAGSQSCMPFVTKALVRAIHELEATESPEAAAAFVVELDEEIMRHELAAAIAARTKQAAPPIARVLWRGADAKGFPAWWIARLADGSYGVLGKFGPRWQWQVDQRDATLASVPDELLDIAVDTTLERDT